MHLLIVALLVLLAVLWLSRELRYQRRRREIAATTTIRGHHVSPPHQRVSDEELRQRAVQLRAAVARGHITKDEAVGSLRRIGGPAVSSERALHILDGE